MTRTFTLSLLALGLVGGFALTPTSSAQSVPAAGSPATAPATEPTTYPVPPKSWVDADTGHVIHRLTDEPGSAGLYFNFNAYTPDGKEMVYSAPDGIHMLELATSKGRLVVKGRARPIVVGKKTPTLYYVQEIEEAAGQTATQPAEADAEVKEKPKALYSVDLKTGVSRKLADLPRRGNIATVNADETLAAGTYIEGDAGEDYGKKRVNPPGLAPGPLVQPANKAQMMEDRLAARLPLVLYTVDLKTGKINELLHSTDWVNHLLFSPADPSLLMYCHEGPWHKIDRIWMIRTDGTQNTQIHKRQMAMEIWGHEFWGLDGQTIWYDLQLPKGEDFFLATYNVQTKERRWYHLQRDEWSIHFNVTADETLLCGDGGDKGQVARAENGKWIYLFRPELLPVSGVNSKDFVQPGVLRSERLVNMTDHNYKLEPNVRFSPDNKLVIFTSNFKGDTYVYGVEVDKAAAGSPAVGKP